MNDKEMIFDENNIEWKEFTSLKGEKYEVGYLKESKEDISSKTSLEGKTDFGINVSWPFGSVAWKDTFAYVKDTASISRYCLTSNNSNGYDYILHFTNTKHYDYRFYDETGDGYRVNTYVNRDHWVRYNSDKPDINYITGS